MTVARELNQEAQRLAELHRLNLLDSEDELALDLMTSLAAQVCAAPMAAISLVDAERQWFKSVHGLKTRETSRSVAFCAHTIAGGKPLMVADALKDPRFSGNPLVTGDLKLRSYLGVPLQVNGFNVGALCVLDKNPRDFNPEQVRMLCKLALDVCEYFEAREPEQSAMVIQAPGLAEDDDELD